MTDYHSGFTIHGLGFLITGAIMEKIVWALSMMAVIGFAIFMVRGYVGRYLLFEVRNDIRYEENISVPLPAMMFCLNSAHTRSEYCFKNKSLYDGSLCNMNTTKDTSLEY